MPAVSRNPSCHLAVLVCCVSLLGIAAAWAVAGDLGLGLALGELAMFCVFLGGALVLGRLEKAASALDEEGRHREAGHSFLCPACLCFGRRAFACSACDREITRQLGNMLGGYVGPCPHCDASLAAASDLAGARSRARVRALCRRCGRMCHPGVFHERGVRVIGVPGSADIAAFCAATPGAAWFRTDQYARADDGSVLTYVIDLGALSGTLPSDHGARAIEGVWLHGDSVDSLGLARTLDRFIRQARLPEQPRERIVAAVAARALPDAVGDVLAARFSRVRCGVGAVAALSGAGFADSPDEASRGAETDPVEGRSSRMRVLATVTLADFESLAAAMDPETRIELERGWVYGEIAGECRYLTHLSNWRVRQDGFQARPSLREIESMWLDPSGMTPLALGEALDQVDRKMADPRSWREEVTLCIAAPEPGPAVRNVLESRYTRILYGVRPDEFLAFGASSLGDGSRRA